MGVYLAAETMKYISMSIDQLIERPQISKNISFSIIKSLNYLFGEVKYLCEMNIN